MIEEFFGLTENPFRLSPDPRFFYASKGHNKALAYLHYGLQQGEGFVVITGEVGSGKTMLISHLLEELDPDEITAANIVTSNIQADDILKLILNAFDIRSAAVDKAEQLEIFEAFLEDEYYAGRRVLLIVDEAQNLPLKTIEELRMLSNFNRDGWSLFQSLLIGQPEFKTVLSDPDLEQLRQRVIASYHLRGLSADETREYIEHRLGMAGWDNDPSFSDEATQLIHESTNGVPRRINLLCNRLLLFATIEERHFIDGEVVKEVVADLKNEITEAQPKNRQRSSARASRPNLTSGDRERASRFRVRRLSSRGGLRSAAEPDESEG